MYDDTIQKIELWTGFPESFKPSPRQLLAPEEEGRNESTDGDWAIKGSC
jgi:hypothetical protein